MKVMLMLQSSTEYVGEKKVSSMSFQADIIVNVKTKSLKEFK